MSPHFATKNWKQMKRNDDSGQNNQNALRSWLWTILILFFRPILREELVTNSENVQEWRTTGKLLPRAPRRSALEWGPRGGGSGCLCPRWVRHWHPWLEMRMPRLSTVLYFDCILSSDFLYADARWCARCVIRPLSLGYVFRGGWGTASQPAGAASPSPPLCGRPIFLSGRATCWFPLSGSNRFC